MAECRKNGADVTVGQCIRRARKQAKLTQAELGAKLGIAYQGVAQWELGLRNPKYNTLLRIADALNVSIDCLLPPREQKSRVRTNADRIRSLTDDELVDRLFAIYRGQMDADGVDVSRLWCDGNSGCIDENGEVECNDEAHKACILRWLKAPTLSEGEPT